MISSPGQQTLPPTRSGSSSPDRSPRPEIESSSVSTTPTYSPRVGTVAETPPQVQPPSDPELRGVHLDELLNKAYHLSITVEIYASDIHLASPAIQQDLVRYTTALSACMSQLQKQLAHHQPHSHVAVKIRESLEQARLSIASVPSS